MTPHTGAHSLAHRAFGKAGLVPALLTCANAFFNLKFRDVLGFVSADEQQRGGGFEEAQVAGDEGAAGFDGAAQWRTTAEQAAPPANEDE